jgi:next-to-BRCA1 protein 1
VSVFFVTYQIFFYIFQVKYGDTLKRFYGCVNGAHFDMNLSALRAKIATAFKFGPDADFILTYIDEDGDAVMLDDDDDLRDAALRQKLNPLRITVQLKRSQPTEQKEKNSTPVKPTPQDPLSQIMSVIEGLKPAQEESLAHIKSAIGEAFKSIPEPIPDALAKLSHEALDAAPQPLAELMKPFVQMMAPSNSGNGPSDAHADGSSSSSSVVTETQAPANKDESKAKACLGLRSVLEEAPAPAPAAPSAGASQGQQPSMYPSVEELLFPSNSVDISVCKGKIDAQSKGKSIMSSATQPAPHAVHAPPPPPPCVSEWFRPRRSQPLQWQSEDNAKVTSDSRWRIPMYKVPYAPPAAVPHAPPGYGPSPHFPYPGRLLSSGHPYGDMSGNMENSAPRSLHRWIQCDGCGVQPIVGPRYKSNVKEDYDLCDSCFHRMGNEVEYTKIDKPVLPHRLLRDPHAYRKVHHPRVVMKSKREKLESRFILDVTVLDGTLMTPSTPFTKIWRMHNNGAIVWPLGTQLIWVGGDQFALQTSVPLEVAIYVQILTKFLLAVLNCKLGCKL